MVRTVLEFATIFLHESIGRRRAPEAREGSYASILLYLVLPLGILETSESRRRCSLNVRYGAKFTHRRLVGTRD